jgi:hypothetical protein
MICKTRNKWDELDSKNPYHEKWFKDHVWELMEMDRNVPHYKIKCKTCGTKIVCLGFINYGGDKIYKFEVENSNLTCDEMVIRDLIE